MVICFKIRILKILHDINYHSTKFESLIQREGGNRNEHLKQDDIILWHSNPLDLLIFWARKKSSPR